MSPSKQLSSSANTSTVPDKNGCNGETNGETNESIVENEPGNSEKERKPKKAMVYLYAFPPSPHVYNLSPFALKLESFMRLHGIPHKTVYTLNMGPKKMIPYIKICQGEDDDENDGEIIADSNTIIPRLAMDFQLGAGDTNLTAFERAIGHAFMRMLEEHTAQIGFHYRYALHMEKFFEVMDIPNRFFNAHESESGRKRSLWWLKFQPGYTKKKTQYRGLAGHTEDELWAFSNDDLRAVSDFLGQDKTWFFGGEEASTIDCVLFGHLSQFLYIPMDYPQKKFIHEECPNIVRFMERFRRKYWPDWEEKCNAVDFQLHQRVDAEATRMQLWGKPVFGVGLAITLAVSGAFYVSRPRK